MDDLLFLSQLHNNRTMSENEVSYILENSNDIFFKIQTIGQTN